jgi:hypothetical protein
VQDDEPDASVYVPAGHSRHFVIIIVFMLPRVHAASNPVYVAATVALSESEVNTTSRNPVEAV